MGGILGDQGTRKDVRDAVELHIGHLGKSHVVEDGPDGQVQLLEVEAPVQAGQGTLLVDLGLDVGQLTADGTKSLFADQGDVPLTKGVQLAEIRSETEQLTQTYLENIEGSSGLWSQRVRVRPHVGEARHVELAQAVLRELNLEGNVVLHEDGEAVAEHGRGPQAPEQLLRQVGLALLLPDGVLEEAEELTARIVH